MTFKILSSLHTIYNVGSIEFKVSDMMNSDKQKIRCHFTCFNCQMVFPSGTVVLSIADMDYISSILHRCRPFVDIASLSTSFEL